MSYYVILIPNIPKLDDGNKHALHVLKFSLIETRFAQFWRAYDQFWRPILKFLPPSTHGTCDDCCDLKEMFRTTRVTWFRT